MNNTFSLSRSWPLMRLIFVRETKRGLLILLASLGIALLLVVISNVSEDKLFNFHERYFVFTLFLGGYLLAGSAFTSFRQRTSTYPYLMLPASSLEKFVVEWIFCVLLYPIIYLIAYALFALLVNAVAQTIVTAFYMPFSINFPVLKSIGMLMLTQSIFLFGAASFQKIPFIKTFLIGLGFVVLSLLGINLVFQNLAVIDNLYDRIYLTTYYFWGAVSLLFGLLTWWKLQEKEA